MIVYKTIKEFEEKQIAELFQSVGWFSGNFPDRLKTALRNSSRVISAWDGNELVGLVRGLDDGIWQAKIDCLVVRSTYQGQGIASALLRILLTEYKSFLYVDVVPDERKNVAFYQKHGFKIIQESIPMQIRGDFW